MTETRNPQLVAPYWRFASLSPSSIIENPTHGEFFTSTAGLADRFVRETIQNSLDAVDDSVDNPKVKIRFTFNKGENALSNDKAKKYLQKIKPHLDASFEYHLQDTSSNDENEVEAVRKAKNILSDPLTSLVVEDFGTTGLTGNVMARGAKAKNNHFWGFFRQVGNSSKSGDAGGSWGLGKWVFADASEINCVFGVTVRKGERNALMMGQAIFKPHEINDSEIEENKSYPAYGSFATPSAETDSDWFPTPIDERDNSNFISDTKNDFNLTRRIDPGLSVIIPFPNDELTPESIAEAVIFQYFLPILNQQLDVEICSDNGNIIAINSNRIQEVISIIPPLESNKEERTRESVEKLIWLTKWVLQNPEENLYEIDEPVKHKTIFDSKTRDELSEKYASGECLQFKISTIVYRKEPKAKSRVTYDLTLEKDDRLNSGHDYYVRGYLHIPEMDYLKGHKARTLIRVNGTSELGHLLRDSEGPAHVKWNRQGDRLKENWINGGQSIERISNAASRILKELTDVPQGKFEDILSEIFFAPTGTKRSSKKNPKDQDLDGDDNPDININSTQGINILPAKGGFYLHGNKQISRVIEIELAYELERGGPGAALSRFKKSVESKSPDFSLTNKQITSKYEKNCKITPVDHNKFKLEVFDAPFSFHLKGFDTHRNIVISIPNKIQKTKSE